MSSNNNNTINGDTSIGLPPPPPPPLSKMAASNEAEEEEDNECWDDAKEFNSDFNNPLALTKEEDLSLHEAVFNNQISNISKILDNQSDPVVLKQLVNRKDKHGNTPLHLACMLGRSEEIVDKLLQCGASVDTKNLQRWTPYHEAISYGNRDIIRLVTKRLKDDVYDVLNRNKLSEKLEQQKDYRLVLKWEFQSWVPFIAKMLPSDSCVINKQGKNIRIDTRLLDLDMMWKRGDSCLIYSSKFEKKWIVMNNKVKKYQYFEAQQHLEKDIEIRVDEVMSTDIMDFDLKSSDVQMTRSTSGWIWKEDKTGRVGNYNAAMYNFQNVFLVTRKRREHLTDEDIKRNKIAYKTVVHVLKFGKQPNSKDLEEADGSDDNNDDENEKSEHEADEHRASLPPPPTPSNVTWEQYLESKPGEHPQLGREQNCKIVKTAVKASVAMSDEFPLGKNEFLDLLSIIPLKHFKKLQEFIEMRLPAGFPIRVDIPVLPFLTARITFEDFTFLHEPVDESLYDIPSDYEEDPNLFPMFSGKFKKQQQQ